MKTKIALHKESERLYVEVWRTRNNRAIPHSYKNISSDSIDRIYTYLMKYSHLYRMDFYPYPNRLTIRFYSREK